MIPGHVGGAYDSGLDGQFFHVLGNSWIITVASALSLFLGDFINDYSFFLIDKHYKYATNIKTTSMCCLVSTIFGQLVDSTIFIITGLYLLPKLVYGVSFIGFDYNAGTLGA